MKALILVGGFGTRLRPLTYSKSKPLVEFVNKPILFHQIEALAQVGVKEIVLAVNFTQNSMFDFIKTAEQTYDVKITVSIEKEPLGTGIRRFSYSRSFGLGQGNFRKKSRRRLFRV